MKTRGVEEQKGITLIALVITIIVLLILAGVTISMLSGENGILRQVANAKTQTEEGQKEEDSRLGSYEDIIAEATGTVPEVTDENVSELTIDGGVKQKTKYKDTKSGNKIAIIPRGFKVSSKESEQKIDTGLVIIDSDGNEYVWIPVFKYDATNCTWGVDYSAVTSENDWVNIEKALINTTNGYTKTYRNSSYSDIWYGDKKTLGNYSYGYYDGSKFVYYTNGNMTKTEYETLYHNMLKSVYKNGGFYIGRYEMGTAVVNSTTEAQTNTRTTASKEYTPSSAKGGTTTNTAAAVKIGAKPVIKSNTVPYNYITQSQAQMLAESLNYSSVTSSLMFGVQWDMVCVFIEKYDTKNTATTKSQWLKSNDYSKLWGNYYNSKFNMNRGFFTITSDRNPVTWYGNTEKKQSDGWLYTTGASDQNSSLNIYDFGGNESEWTLERCSDSGVPCVSRGCNFWGGYSYASSRGYGSVIITHFTISARPSLYIQ